MHYRECRRYEPCRRVWGYPPSKISNLEALKRYFQQLVMRYVSEKSTSSLKKTNPSTDLMCLAQQVQGEGGSCPLAPPLATALVGVGNDPENEIGMPIKVVLVGNQTRLYSCSPVRYPILPNKLSIMQSSFSQKAKMHACDLLDIIS